jgi:hypothetical protein
MLDDSLRAVGILPSASPDERDAVLKTVNAETGEPYKLNPNGDPRALVRQAPSVAEYLLQNRNNPAPAFDLEAARLCVVEISGDRRVEGLPSDGPSIVDNPSEYNERIFHSLGVHLRATARHGQTTAELPQPWREVTRRYVFRRPSDLRVGPDVQLAEGVTLRTRGLLVLPTSRARIDGMPIRFRVSLGAYRVLPGRWDFHMQQITADTRESLLVELPAAVVAQAKTSKKKAA